MSSKIDHTVLGHNESFHIVFLSSTLHLSLINFLLYLTICPCFCLSISPVSSPEVREKGNRPKSPYRQQGFMEYLVCGQHHARCFRHVIGVELGKKRFTFI